MPSMQVAPFCKTNNIFEKVNMKNLHSITFKSFDIDSSRIRHKAYQDIISSICPIAAFEHVGQYTVAF